MNLQYLSIIFPQLYSLLGVCSFFSFLKNQAGHTAPCKTGKKMYTPGPIRVCVLFNAKYILQRSFEFLRDFLNLEVGIS